MSRRSKEEYLSTIIERYLKSNKEQKNEILNEFCKVCKYNRKYAIRILNNYSLFCAKSKKDRCGPKRKYDSELFQLSKSLL